MWQYQTYHSTLLLYFIFLQKVILQLTFSPLTQNVFLSSFEMDCYIIFGGDLCEYRRTSLIFIFQYIIYLLITPTNLLSTSYIVSEFCCSQALRLPFVIYYILPLCVLLILCSIPCFFTYMLHNLWVLYNLLNDVPQLKQCRFCPGSYVFPD